MFTLIVYLGSGRKLEHNSKAAGIAQKWFSFHFCKKTLHIFSSKKKPAYTLPTCRVIKSICYIKRRAENRLNDEVEPGEEPKFLQF